MKQEFGCEDERWKELAQYHVRLRYYHFLREDLYYAVTQLIVKLSYNVIVAYIT